MHGTPELLVDGCVWIVVTHIRVIWFVSIGAPMPLVLSGIGIEHDDAFVAISVRDIQFIGFRIDEHFRRTLQVFDVVAAFALERMPDLHQEFSALRKFQDLIVRIGARLASLWRGAGPVFLHFGINRAAIPADPHVALVVDRNSMVGVGPIVAFAGSAPVAYEVAFLIEFKYRRRSHAAFRAGRIRVAIGLFCFERAAAMNDPDVVLRIRRYSDGHSDYPVIRQRFWPHRIDLEHRGLHSRSLDSCLLFQNVRSSPKRNDQREYYQAKT